ncbi:MAG TPA: diguanylate cyclase [Gaiellaceae bacterium]|nr:diguanylate cyclase [Gaiellaceae bacterium]
MAVRHHLAAVAPAHPEDGRAIVPDAPRTDSLVQSYRQLADVFHDILSEHSLDNLLERIADTLADLVPHDTLSIYQADDGQTVLIPVLARDKWAEKIMESRSEFGQGITGWAALHREPVRANQAHLDPRTITVPGTPPDEPEALISIPLIARDLVKGTLNMYRLGEAASFSDDEFELACRFADAAALALDNAQIRARLEYQAQTDSLTGLYNHRYFHDRLRAELTRASRARDSVAVVMLDIDDFKRVNDVYGHGSGDQVLTDLAELLRGSLRGSDVVCRLGGEEFGMIMPGGDAGDAVTLARRLTDRLAEVEFGPAGKITISVGVSQGPEHAMNPRELVACAEAAMMTAKARGKNQIVLFDEQTSERPDGKPDAGRDVRSIAHLKMLQSLAGKLNRLNDVRQIGETIADELRLLIDYHNCRVSVIEGDEVVPIAFRGELLSRSGERVEFPRTRIGEGITGHVAASAEALLVENTLECEFAVMIPGTHLIEESQIAVPLRYGARVIGVIAISKLGVGQFDEDDVRLLEVLAGHASVALENARLYEAQRREADHLKALLEFTGAISEAATPHEIGAETVHAAARLLGGKKCALWLPGEDGDFRIAAHADYDADPALRRLLELALPAADVHTVVGERSEPFLVTTADAEGITTPPPGLDWPNLALAPLRNDGSLDGFISVREPTVASEHTIEEILRLLRGISDQAAVALERARSYDDLEETFVSTVEALANALEANDEYTSSHTRWITDASLRVGEALGLDGGALKQLELGALFHDIGKIGIPTSILLKPGPLTSEERRIMETHPELGERILEPIDRLAEVRTIVRSCHERWDGGGYPDGKAGEEISLEARIILVCDAFHAMTTDRPYRKRLSGEEACRRLRAGAATQFDPAVVDVFLSLPLEVPVPHDEASGERLAS